MRLLILVLGMLVLALAPPHAAEAYIGPGAGAGTIAVVLGILASILMAFVAIVWYPLKRLARGRKARRQQAGEGSDAEQP